MTTTLRIDPRIMESLNAQLKVAKERVALYPKGSAQHENALEQVRQQEAQLKRITAGTMGVSQ